MRKPIIYFAAIAFLFGGANLFISAVNSQNAPFTMGQILKALNSINDARGAQKRTLIDRVLGDVRRRKVDFQLTQDNEDFLREEGATDEFIETIRRNSPRIPTPTPTITPTQTPTNPTSANDYFAIAYNCFGKKDYDCAARNYSKAIELKPDYTEAYINRGVTYKAKGDIDLAIKDYSKAIELKPDYAVAYYNRGNFL
jgi:tetratricopeptide (TPR) repeat protein